MVIISSFARRGGTNRKYVEGSADTADGLRAGKGGAGETHAKHSRRALQGFIFVEGKTSEVGAER